VAADPAAEAADDDRHDSMEDFAAEAGAAPARALQARFLGNPRCT
jgi:hypothetical protein